MSLLGLQAVDREDDLIDRFVLAAQGFGVLLTCGEHDLVTLNVLGDGIVRELDRVVVQELGLDLGDRHVARTASMSDPAEDVPADRPAGRGDGGFEFGTLGLGVAGAVAIGAVVELADQLHRAVEGMEAAIAVIADVHHPPTDRTVPVEDVEFPESEIRIRGPLVRHPADLHVLVRSIDCESAARGYAKKPSVSSSLSGHCFFLKAILFDDAVHASGADGETSLAELLGDDVDRGVGVEKTVADDLSLDFVGANIVVFGAGFVALESCAAMFTIEFEQLKISLLAEAELVGGLGGTEPFALAFDEHGEAGDDEVIGENRELSGGADDAMCRQVEVHGSVLRSRAGCKEAGYGGWHA